MLSKLYYKVKVNIWRLLTIAISLYAIFVIGRTVLSIIRTSRDIDRLRTEEKRYKSDIARNKAIIEKFDDPQYIEKFAREKYGMQRPDEDVYIMK